MGREMGSSMVTLVVILVVMCGFAPSTHVPPGGNIHYRCPAAATASCSLMRLRGGKFRAKASKAKGGGVGGFSSIKKLEARLGGKSKASKSLSMGGMDV